MTTGFYNKYLLFIAGLGGLLYGIDVGVIAGALPYLQATTDYSAAQLSTVVAAVLGGSVLSSLFAGALADLFGRKWLMIVSGICFVLSVPVICIPSGFGWLVAGRILQGAAAGFIGVVVPLYLAESLTADKRGFGTGMFQFMLTVGLVFAALVGLYFAQHVETIAETGTAADILAAKNFAWRAIFWACAVPGVIFTLGAFAISDSPRWLYRKGKLQAALAALTRSHGADKAQAELDEMGKAEKAAQEEAAKTATAHKDSLLQKKYVVPFVLAVVILACNQATGINSVLAYIVDVLKQAGLEGAWANAGDLSVKILNMVMTLVAMFLVDRLGRKALLTIGTSGIIVGLLGVAFLFWNSERKMVDYTVNPADYAITRTENIVDEKTGLEVKDESGKVKQHDVTYRYYQEFTPEAIQKLTGAETFEPSQVKIVYKENGKTAVKSIVVQPRPEGATEQQLKNWQDEVTFKVKEFKEVEEAQDVPYTLDGKPATLVDVTVRKNVPVDFELVSLSVGPLPSPFNGWMVTIFFIIFIATYAVGPGVCVWLALSELMPNRIRSMGMSIALLINQGVSYLIAQTFLPVVGMWGYSTIFFFCAGCTVIYWITAVFFLPETKGRTLEEIEAYFEGKKKLS